MTLYFLWLKRFILLVMNYDEALKVFSVDNVHNIYQMADILIVMWDTSADT